MLRMPDPSQKDHHSSDPQLGTAISLQASSVSLLLRLSRKPNSVKPGTGRDTATGALHP